MVSKKQNFEMKQSKNQKRSKPIYQAPKHKCTDIICTLLFGLFVILLVIVSVIAYKNGKPSNLVLPHDSQGRICGETKGLEDKKYLLFFDLTKCLSFISAINGCPSPQVCVSECPDSYAYDKVPSTTDKIAAYCNPFNPQQCPNYLLKSKPLFGRCVPEIIAGATDGIKDIIEVFDPVSNSSIPIQAFNGTGFSDLTVATLKKAAQYLKNLINLKEIYQKVFEDFTKTYGMILIALGIAAIVSLIWIFLLRFIVKPLVYLSMLLVLLVLGFITYFSINEYLNLRKQNQTEFKLEFENLYNIDYLRNLKETWLALSIIFGIILVILFLIIVFLRKRIQLAVEMIKEVSKAVIDIPSSLIWPIIPFILTLGCIVYCVSVSLFLASSGIQLYKIIDTNVTNPIEREITELNIGDYCTPDNFQQIKESLQNPKYDTYECYFYKFGFNTTLPFGIDSKDASKYYSLAIELINEYQWAPQAFVYFMLFWLTTFTISLNEMTLAGAFGTWYFTRFDSRFKLKSLPFMTIFASFFRAIFYHLGTLAFGSLIVAIIKMIRLLLEYICGKAKKSDNKIAEYITKCLKCCFWCLEKFIKFLNRRAFIITATQSLNFCSAARKAFKIITSNVLRVVIVDKLTDFILFISNLCITLGIGALGFFFFTGKIPIDYLTNLRPELNFYVAPLILMVLGCYFVAKIFFDVFALGIDTILLCALIDSDENDGSDQRPYFMSKRLRRILIGNKASND